MTLMARLNFRLEQRRKSTQGFLRKYPVSSSSNRQRCAVKVYCSAESQIGICLCCIKTIKGLVEGRREANRAIFLLFGKRNQSVLKVPGV